MIIFSLTESTSQLKTTKQQYNEQQILELCREIVNSLTETDIMEIRRLGKVSENASSRRLVPIKFSKTDKQSSILRNLHRVKSNDKFGNIKIDHDKTKQEREESKNDLKKQRDGSSRSVGGIHIQSQGSIMGKLFNMANYGEMRTDLAHINWENKFRLCRDNLTING